MNDARPHRDGGGSAACELAATPGPVGILVDYRASDAGEWVLTRDDTLRTTLWEDTGDGWETRLLPAACTAGVMTLGPSGWPTLACLVRAQGSLYHARAFALSETEVTTTSIHEAEAGDAAGPMPRSIAFDAADRPHVLWQLAQGTDGGLFLYAGIDRQSGGTWSVLWLYEEMFDASAALYPVGEEMRIVEYDGNAGSVVIRRAGASVPVVAEIPGAEAGFAVAPGTSALHVATIGDGGLKVRSVTSAGGSQPEMLATDATHVAITVVDDMPFVAWGSAADGLVVASERDAWAPVQIDEDPGAAARIQIAGGELRLAYQHATAGAITIVHETCAP